MPPPGCRSRSAGRLLSPAPGWGRVRASRRWKVHTGRGVSEESQSVLRKNEEEMSRRILRQTFSARITITTTTKRKNKIKTKTQASLAGARPSASSPSEVSVPRVPAAAVALSLMNEPQKRQPYLYSGGPAPLLTSRPRRATNSPKFSSVLGRTPPCRGRGPCRPPTGPPWDPRDAGGRRGAAGSGARREGIPTPPPGVPVTQLAI